MKENTKKLHSLLFHHGIKLKKLYVAQICGFSSTEFDDALDELKEYTDNTGVILIDDSEYITLSYPSELSNFIGDITKKEYVTTLSQTSQEILSLILYIGPVSKSNIDFLRGVNSQYTIKKLMIRGLIQEVVQEKKGKSYSISVEYLAYLGIKHAREAVNYKEHNSQINESLSTMYNDTN